MYCVYRLQCKKCWALATDSEIVTDTSYQSLLTAILESITVTKEFLASIQPCYDPDLVMGYSYHYIINILC